MDIEKLSKVSQASPISSKERSGRFLALLNQRLTGIDFVRASTPFIPYQNHA